MKLVTHNFLSCNVKGVKNGYPLKIDADAVEVRDADFDPEFIRKMMTRIRYDVLREAAQQMGVKGLPAHIETRQLDEDDDLLQLLHHAMLEIHLEEGRLICPESGRQFPVSAGIPNMLLHEDEV